MEPSAEKGAAAASGRTTRRSALLSGGKEATPKQKSAITTTALMLAATPARGLGAMTTPLPNASTPTSNSNSRGAAASGGILTPRKRPLLQSSTVITLSGSFAAAAASGRPPRAPLSTTAAAVAPREAPASAAAPLLPPTTTTTATARAAALVSGLPDAHASLAAAFGALHAAAALVRGRGGQRLTFEGDAGAGAGNRGGGNSNSARAAVERATGRRFTVSHVLQIKALYPEGVELEYIDHPGGGAIPAAPLNGSSGGNTSSGSGSRTSSNLAPMLLSVRISDAAAGSAREEFARRLRSVAEAAARRAAREAEGRCNSPAASGCRKGNGGVRARRGDEDEEEADEEEATKAPAGTAAAAGAAADLLPPLPEAPLPPLPAGRVAATPHFASAAASEGKEEGEEEKAPTTAAAAAAAEGKQETAAHASAFPRPPLAPPSSTSITSRARQRLTFGDAGGAAAVGAAAAALSDAEVLRASLPPELAREAIERNNSAGLADLPISAVRAAHASKATRDAVSDPKRAEARTRSALLALLPRAFDCARSAFGGAGSGSSSASGFGSLRIPGGRPPTPTPCVKPLSFVHDALSRAVLSGSSSAIAMGDSSSSHSALAVLDAPTLLKELAAAAPEVFSIEPPRLGREAEGPVLRVNRGADAGAARARLSAAAAADRASNAA